MNDDVCLLENVIFDANIRYSGAGWRYIYTQGLMKFAYIPLSCCKFELEANDREIPSVLLRRSIGLRCTIVVTFTLQMCDSPGAIKNETLFTVIHTKALF